MRLYWKALVHMGGWGLLGGALLGCLYGTFLYPIIGSLYGVWFGGLVGLILGLPSGVLVAFITHHYAQTDADPVAYGWTLGAAVAIFGLVGAWVAFSSLFGGYPSWFFPGVPALIAGGTAAYASKRFASRYLSHDYEPKKRKAGEYV